VAEGIAGIHSDEGGDEEMTNDESMFEYRTPSILLSGFVICLSCFVTADPI